MLVLWLVASGIASAAEKSEPLPTFAATSFQFRPPAAFLPLADAQRMLESIGQDSHIRADNVKARMRGLFRLRDWTPDCAVRVAFADQGSHLRIHVWARDRVSRFSSRPRARPIAWPNRRAKRC